MRESVSSLLASLLLVLLCAACENSMAATEVLVSINSDLRLGDQLVRVDVEVFAADGTGLPLQQASFALAAQGGSRVYRLPLSFSIVPSTQQDTRGFRVVVTGIGNLPDGSLGPVVEQQTVAAFRPNRQSHLSVYLYQQCFKKLCRDAQGRRGDLTCNSAGECGAVPVGGETPNQGVDAAMQDDQVNVSMVDAAMLDAANPGDAGTSNLDAQPALDAVSADATGPLPDAGSDAMVAIDAGPTCDGTSCVGPCTGSNGAAVCIGSTLYLCNADGTTQSIMTCASARQCELGIGPKTCAPCSPGSFRCTDVHLEVCGNDGFTWSLSKDCATTALCNASAGDCTTAACTSTTRVCSGDNLQGCNATQTGLVTIEQCDPGMCDQAGKQCDKCVANAKSCSGDTRVVCDATGQTTTRTPCTGSTPRCVGAATCVQCTSAADCSAPANTCQSATCTAAGSCGVTNKAARSPCSGGGVCNGSGSCVQCVSNADCSGVSGKPFCSNNVCVQCSLLNPCTGAHEACENNTCVKQPYCGDGIWTQGVEACDYSARPRWDRFTCNENCQVRNLYNTCTVDSGGNVNNCETACGVAYCWYACSGTQPCRAPPVGSNLQTFCWSNQACVLTGCSSDNDCPVGIPCQSMSGMTFCWGCTNSSQCSGKTCVIPSGKTSGTCQ